jgi:hypothetical protein
LLPLVLVLVVLVLVLVLVLLLLLVLVVLLVLLVLVVLVLVLLMLLVLVVLVLVLVLVLLVALLVVVVLLLLLPSPHRHRCCSEYYRSSTSAADTTTYSFPPCRLVLPSTFIRKNRKQRLDLVPPRAVRLAMPRCPDVPCPESSWAMVPLARTPMVVLQSC